MRRLLTLLLISITLFGFTSCEDSYETENLNPETRTVLVYFPWSGNNDDNKGASLYYLLKENLDSIKSAVGKMTGLGNNRVLVFVSESNSEAYMYEVLYRRGKAEVTTLHHYGENFETLPDITTTDGLRTILNQAYNVTQSNKWQMIIGCHGLGWPEKDFSPKARAFGGGSNATKMDVDDFAAAVTTSNIGKFEYILFDDCYMAGVETVHYLKDATHYFIASTSEIMARGMPYNIAWQYLVGEPNYAGIINSFSSYYNSQTYGTNNSGCLSVVDCTQIDNLTAVMKEINAKGYELTTQQRNSLQYLDGFRDHAFYDIRDYVKTLTNNNSALMSQFDAALTRLVPYTYTTPYIFSAFMNGTYGQFFKIKDTDTYSGISTSDPSIDTYIVNTREQTSWWKATH
jgi:hypothetical protein